MSNVVDALLAAKDLLIDGWIRGTSHSVRKSKGEMRDYYCITGALVKVAANSAATQSLFHAALRKRGAHDDVANLDTSLIRFNDKPGNYAARKQEILDLMDEVIVLAKEQQDSIA